MDALDRVRARSIDRVFLPQHRLDVVDRSRVSALPWRGQFTPGLAELMFATYDPGTGAVLDPFAGSGTTLLEAARRGRPSVGVEINPAAVELARVVSLAACAPDVRAGRLRDAAKFLDGDVANESALLEGIRERPELADILTPTLLLAMRNGSSATRERIEAAFRVVRDAAALLPGAEVPTRLVLGDARSTPVEDASVGFVLTSPPYINVFNYHQNYRPAVERLGYDALRGARAELGANRKHRQNRFLTVVQYAQDMLLVIAELARVVAPGGRVVIVVGRESRVRGVAFPNAELIGAAFELDGRFEFARWHERSFVSRFGETIYEDVLVLERRTGDAPAVDAVGEGRGLGVRLLAEATTADPVAARQIADAIAEAARVLPSPFVWDAASDGAVSGA